MKIKKTVLSLLLAGAVFGFSAFTTAKRGVTLRFYKTSAAYPLANDARGYTYYGEDRCQNGGTLCSAEWEVANSEYYTEGTQLSTTGVSFVTNSVVPGHFE